MLVLLFDQWAVPVFWHSVNLDSTRNHLLRLQVSVSKSFDHTGKILL